jgi:purine-binding chemotaxis protein CheW
MPEAAADNVSSSMIVIRVEDVLVALEVDSVAEIHEFAPSEIVNMPSLVMNDDTGFLERVVNLNGQLVVLMDVCKILTQEELAKVKKMKEDME